jgi:hypothetical protein
MRVSCVYPLLHSVQFALEAGFHLFQLFVEAGFHGFEVIDQFAVHTVFIFILHVPNTDQRQVGFAAD